MPSNFKQSILPVYCLEQYAKVQNYDQYFRFESEFGMFCFEVKDHLAHSLPKCPIGGSVIWTKEYAQFSNKLMDVEYQLRQAGAREIVVTTNPEFYPTHIPAEWMLDQGYLAKFTEITHFLPISDSFKNRLHTMQKRHLSRKPDFELLLETADSLNEIHDFISKCRKQQNLEINISLEKLQQLFQELPEKYDLFTARQANQIISAVVCVRATSHIAYYFLPATDNNSKAQSPMVHLLAFIHEFYQNLGFEKIDLGISSQKGAPQNSLIEFKERMGGIRSSRITWKKQLT